MTKDKEPEKTRYIRIAVDEDTYSDLVNGAETTHIVVKSEDVVESESILQYSDILNISIRINEKLDAVCVCIEDISVMVVFSVGSEFIRIFMVTIL